MLNRFHVWFPGGIVIGALLSTAMTAADLSWQLQVAVILVPTAFYGLLLLKNQFPEFNRQAHSTVNNIKHLFSPLFLILALCMTLTATTELGTQQWIERILSSTGAAPMLILAMMSGLMAVGRFFAGPVVHRLNPIGVLLTSAVLATCGIFLMSQAQGYSIYLAAILFALGCTYFWPTMLGCVAEYLPKTGALGLSLMGGIGMFAVSMWNPVIGGWIDTARAQAQSQNLSPEQTELLAGQAVLSNLTFFPLVLIVAFIGLYLFINKTQLSKRKTPIAAK